MRLALAIITLALTGCNGTPESNHPTRDYTVGTCLLYTSLYTHAKLTQRIGWYERLGFAITHHEDMADRRLTHMRKTLAKAGQ